MARKAKSPDRPARGGSDSARNKGLTGILIHVTPEQRRRIGVCAADRGEDVKKFSTKAVLRAAGIDSGETT